MELNAIIGKFLSQPLDMIEQTLLKNGEYEHVHAQL
jgi:hypothetical protein